MTRIKYRIIILTTVLICMNILVACNFDKKDVSTVFNDKNPEISTNEQNSSTNKENTSEKEFSKNVNSIPQNSESKENKNLKSEGKKDIELELKKPLENKENSENKSNKNTEEKLTSNKGTTQKSTAGVLNEDLSISIVGDILLEDKIFDYYKKNKPENILSGAINDFASSELVVGNLETPLSVRGEAEKNKQYTFRAKPEAVSILNTLGINMVTLANNHILDFGAIALKDTLQILNKNNISYAGAGENLDLASRPVYIEKASKKIAFIASSHVVPFVHWYATENKAGVAACYNSTTLIKEVKEARKKADIVITYIHWGNEKEDIALAYQKDMAKKLIDAGCDLVIGSHPHVLQGFEYYKNKLIAYSLGNFIFTDATKDTMILKVSFKGTEISQAKVIPYRINSYVPYKIQKAELVDKFFRNLNRISFSAYVDGNGNVVSKKN